MGSRRRLLVILALGLYGIAWSGTQAWSTSGLVHELNSGSGGVETKEWAGFAVAPFLVLSRHLPSGSFELAAAAGRSWHPIWFHERTLRCPL